MILSLHPVIETDVNRIIAGRPPTPEEVELIRRAEAIVLPQGVTREVFELATRYCKHVFPDYRARFQFPGKIGVARMCTRYHIPHPRTRIYPTVQAYLAEDAVPDLPAVLKSTHGGEGEGVYLVKTEDRLREVLALFEQMEREGRSGFVLQEYVDHGGHDLRVVLIGTHLESYWRKPPHPRTFHHHLSSGARIDRKSDPHLQQLGRELVQSVSRKTGINLAGFDVLFPVSDPRSPLLIEINYFFGRRGLGGSRNFYRLLEAAVRRWIDSLG